MSANRIGDPKRLMRAAARWDRWRKSGMTDDQIMALQSRMVQRLERIINAVHKKEEREHRVIRFKGMEGPR